MMSDKNHFIQVYNGWETGPHPTSWSRQVRKKKRKLVFIIFIMIIFLIFLISTSFAKSQIDTSKYYKPLPFSIFNRIYSVGIS